jgi:hypothetical protein
VLDGSYRGFPSVDKHRLVRGCKDGDRVEQVLYSYIDRRVGNTVLLRDGFVLGKALMQTILQRRLYEGL